MRRYQDRDQLRVVRILGGIDLWRELGFGQTEWERFFAHRRRVHPGFVIQVHSEIVGVALLGRSSLPGVVLDLLAVDPAFQDRGLGTLALTWVERYSFADGTNLFVTVTAGNHRARQFYRRRGFRELGPIPITASGLTEILLCKSAKGKAPCPSGLADARGWR